MRTITLAAIFLAAVPAAAGAQARDPHVVVRSALPAGGLHEISGTIRGISGTQLVLQLRNGRSVLVDAARAEREQRATALFVARPVNVYGAYTAPGKFTAWAIQRARTNPRTWAPDR
jgi:hypothetical protein